MLGYTDDDGGLQALLAMDGASFAIGPDALVEITARRTDLTAERPHGIISALVLRARSGGPPWVRFDNGHAAERTGGTYRRKRASYDHWHRTAKDKGRPYKFTTAAMLLDDFWREVKRTLDDQGITHDL